MPAVLTAQNSTNHPASVISMSWGSAPNPEPNDTAYDSYFTTPTGHQNIIFVAAAGGYGTPGCYPAYSPNVVAVGGTLLTLDGSNWQSERVWGDKLPPPEQPYQQFGGTGYGESKYESEPAYQAGVQSSGGREIADVSFDAAPVSIQRGLRLRFVRHRLERWHELVWPGRHERGDPMLGGPVRHRRPDANYRGEAPAEWPRGSLLALLLASGSSMRTTPATRPISTTLPKVGT